MQGMKLGAKDRGQSRWDLTRKYKLWRQWTLLTTVFLTFETPNVTGKQDPYLYYNMCRYTVSISCWMSLLLA